MRKKKNKQSFSANNDPFVNLVLDEEEQLFEEALARGEFEKDSEFEATKAMLQEAASRYLELHTSKPITLRVNQLDLIKIKAKAKRKQIPYQTLLGAVLHAFAEGERELSLK
jgi:predicted DNA binding CopG/RHH family protein